MRVETEKEFKFQLRQEDFLKLKSFMDKEGYKKIGVVNQTNFYIDTEDFNLRKLGVALRVRHFIDTDTFEFTAKVKNNLLDGDKDLKIKDELTIDLSKEEAEEILKNKKIKEYVHVFKDKAEILKESDIVDKLIVIGNLSTERTNYFVNEEAMISFDKSRYLGTEDYEVELETNNIEEDRRFLKEIFTENNIKAYEENKSKVKRFVEKLGILFSFVYNNIKDRF